MNSSGHLRHVDFSLLAIMTRTISLRAEHATDKPMGRERAMLAAGEKADRARISKSAILAGRFTPCAQVHDTNTIRCMIPIVSGSSTIGWQETADRVR